MTFKFSITNTTTLIFSKVWIVSTIILITSKWNTHLPKNIILSTIGFILLQFFWFSLLELWLNIVSFFRGSLNWDEISQRIRQVLLFKDWRGLFKSYYLFSFFQHVLYSHRLSVANFKKFFRSFKKKSNLGLTYDLELKSLPAAESTYFYF